MLPDDKNAWRDEEPTNAQIDYLKALCRQADIKFLYPKNRGQASDKIDKLLVELRIVARSDY